MVLTLKTTCRKRKIGLKPGLKRYLRNPEVFGFKKAHFFCKSGLLIVYQYFMF